MASTENAGRRGPILCPIPGVGSGARGSASSSRNCEASSTDSWRAGGPARSSAEALVMRVERRGWLIRVLVTRATRAAWEETSEQVESDSQVVSDTEAAGVGGVQARQGEQGCCRGGRAVDRGLRDRSEEQSLPDLESDVVGDVLSASGASGGDTEAARWGDQNAGYSHRGRQDRSDGGRSAAGAPDGGHFPWGLVRVPAWQVTTGGGCPGPGRGVA